MRLTGRTNTVEDEDHHHTGGLGRTSSLAGSCVEFGTLETHCSLLPSSQTLISQWACFSKAVPQAHVHGSAKSCGALL